MEPIIEKIASDTYDRVDIIEIVSFEIYGGILLVNKYPYYKTLSIDVEPYTIPFLLKIT